MSCEATSFAPFAIELHPVDVREMKAAKRSRIGACTQDVKFRYEQLAQWHVATTQRKDPVA